MIPEDATSDQIKEILSRFEDSLTERLGGITKEIETKTVAQKEADKKAKFDAAVEKFKAAHPAIFEKGSEIHLEFLNNLLHKEMATGKEPDAALADAYTALGKTTTWKEPPSAAAKGAEEKKKLEEGHNSLFAEDDSSNGNLLSPTKTSESTIEKKGVKNERDAVLSAFKEMKAEGLSLT